MLLLCSSSWRKDLFAGAVTRSQVPHMQSNKQGQEEEKAALLSCQKALPRCSKMRRWRSPLKVFFLPCTPTFAGGALLFYCLYRTGGGWEYRSLWLQCGDTDCLPGQEEVNLSGNLGREQVPKSRLPGHMAAQVRLFCRTRSKVVWETRIFRDYTLWQQESNHV